MKSIADGLPPEIRAQVNPVWFKNEIDYWAAHEGLLEQYRGKWVAFADGKVVACGDRRVFVSHEAARLVQGAFVICVGYENHPTRMRRARFPYEQSPTSEPLPVLTVEYRPLSGSPRVTLDRVIADTGADGSLLPWDDCERLQLDALKGSPGQMMGVGGAWISTLYFDVVIHLDGRDFPCEIQADFLGHERLLGRDVLNQLDVLFRGPAGEVVVNP